MKIFEQQPDFIDRDPRSKQADDRAFTADAQQSRYEAWIPPEFLKGKSVLDLGCCCGAVGGYVLTHGASRYVGIEISSNLADIARENLVKYHAGKDHEILVSSAEDYLATSLDQFDFVIAAGILHGVTNVIAFIHQLSQIAKVVLIESVHPPMHAVDHLLKQIIELQGEDRTDEQKNNIFTMMSYVEFSLPVLVLHDKGRMCLEDSESTVTNVMRPLISIGALKMLFNRLGFAEDVRPYRRLNSVLPKYFGYGRRFGMAFIKQTDAKPMSFAELFVNRDSQTVEHWDSKNTEGMI